MEFEIDVSARNAGIVTTAIPKSCQGRPTIAHGFNRGLREQPSPSPGGAKEIVGRPTAPSRFAFNDGYLLFSLPVLCLIRSSSRSVFILSSVVKDLPVKGDWQTNGQETMRSTVFLETARRGAEERRAEEDGKEEITASANIIACQRNQQREAG